MNKTKTSINAKSDRQDRRKVFFALWPDDRHRGQIAALAREFDAGGKRTPVANLHVTLVFMGLLDQQQIRCVRRQAVRISAKSFDLRIDMLGSFRNRILWLGCSQTPRQLLRLHDKLENRLQQHCNYQPEERMFTPHITIQRKLSRTTGKPVMLDNPLIWPVNSFSLICSRAGNSNPVYSELARWHLN